MNPIEPLNALTLPLAGTQLIEASAGTGKTWTIAALYVRLVLGHGRDTPLLPNQILVMTFTKAATSELRERIRARLTEAARAFRDDIAPDDFLRELIAQYPAGDARAAAARRLELAAQWMDEAAVFTIHGWCQRMLAQHAFASGERLAEGGLADETALRTEAVRDYWRCHVAPLNSAGAEWIKAWWKSPDDLARAVKPLLPLPAGGLRVGDEAVPETPDTTACINAAGASVRAAEVEARAAWRADADAIELMLEKAVQTKLISGSKWPATTLHNRLRNLHEWANGAAIDLKTLTYASQAALTNAANKGKTAPHHPAFAAVQRVVDARAVSQGAYPPLLAHAAQWIAAREDAARRAQDTLGYDDMLQRLAAALDGEHGEALARIIAAQFPVALVDEFQDTDPQQWRSLKRVYVDRPDTTLCLIGDPKQAIYGFRGADIHTYMDARKSAATPWWTLPVNFRSTPALVNAVNRVFTFADAHAGGAFDFGADLPFHAVQAHGRSERLVLDGAPMPAMQLALHTAPTLPATAAWRETMAAHAAAQIVSWLDAAAAGRCGFVRDDGTRQPLTSGDIAILVRDKDDAAAMRAALHARGLPHVYLSDRLSVYQSTEARDLLHWLNACSQPGDENAMRTALASPGMVRSRAELDRLGTDEAFHEDCAEHFRALHAQWRHHGVLATVHDLLHRFDVPQRLLATPNGERALTNLLHLAELLQQAAATLDGERAVIRHLALQIENPATGETADDQLMRLESEAAVIKLVTVHAAKGLEYPVVLLPFVCGAKETKRKGPLVARDKQGQRHVDLVPADTTWQAVDGERKQEDLRLLYVALTRARHACWLGISDLKHGTETASALPRSAFGHVLGGADDLPARLDALRGGCTDIVVTRLPATSADTALHAASASRAMQPARRATLTPATPWWVASYSALAARAGALPAAHAAPETAAQDTLTEPAAAGAAVASLDLQGIHAFPRGAAPGTFLHELLEHCAHAGFSTIAANPAALRDGIAQRCARHGLQKWVEPLTQWLQAFLQAPLPLPGGGALPLQALTVPRQYRAELEFWFEAHDVSTQALDALVTRDTLDGAPRPALAPRVANGMLKGFIDLAFEHAGRWYVADYKSNWLGANALAYTPEAMRTSVLHSRYDLQYAIYTLALHRQLKARLPGYDYERHMGGVLYLYLRGVDGAGHGVHGERLPRALVEALDAHFAGHAAKDHAA